MNWHFLNYKVDKGYRHILGKDDEPLLDEELEIVLRKLRSNQYFQKKIDEQKSFNAQKAYKEFLYANRRRAFPFSTLLKVVSVLVLGFFVIGGSLFIYRNYAKSLHNEGTIGHRAILVKQNGEAIDLSQGSGVIKEENGIYFSFDDSGLHYETVNIKLSGGKPISNTLIVPRGNEYSLSLSDGTQVWLNADSQLKYLVNFYDCTREVVMTGELYFNVKHQEAQPFIVRTQLGDIIVTGTEFNVKAYPEEESVMVTLVSGSVKYRCLDNKEICLRPNQQLIMKKGEKPQIINVDPIYSICWKEGTFMFQDRTLEEIFKQLERWYNVKVVYTSEDVKKLHFSGDLSRYKKIETFIKMFRESSDVKMEIKGNTIIVGL